VQYFILLPGDTEKDCVKDTNLIGESSFNTFYAGLGLTALMKMVDKSPELLPSVTIKTDQGKSLSVEEFLTAIQKLKVIM
jgi:hypothetical protein